MSIHDHMIALAHQSIEEHPAAWSKIMRVIRERLHDDAGFRRDMRAFSDVPAHVRDFQAEWYYAVQCRTRVLMGDVFCCGVEVRAAPLADAQMEENDRLLQAGLRHPFYGGAARCSDSDGCIKWKEPITATRFVKQGSRLDPVLVQIAPWSAPLEVGYTHGYRSYLHLYQESALVCWCYGEPILYVFKMTDEAVAGVDRFMADQPSGTKALMPVDLDAVKQMVLWDN